MSRRITAADVEVVRREPQQMGGVLVEAHVRGLKTTYVVDHNEAWSHQWLCSCGYAPDCAHIRAAKRAIA